MRAGADPTSGPLVEFRRGSAQRNHRVPADRAIAGHDWQNDGTRHGKLRPGSDPSAVRAISSAFLRESVVANWEKPLPTV